MVIYALAPYYNISSSLKNMNPLSGIMHISGTNNNSSLIFDELRAKLLYQEQRLQHLHGAYDSSSQVAAASYNVYYYIMRELGQSAILDLKSSNDSTNMEISS